MTVDVLAIGAHPDDVELGVGGTLLLAAAQGARVGVLDLTHGERASRGTREERDREAEAAARLLNAAVRENAGLPDGGLADTPDQRAKLIEIVRRLRPRVILAPMSPDRHPDHEAAHALVRSANFFAGVASFGGGEPYRADHVFYFYPYYQAGTRPTFVVDISAQFDRKIEALRAYRSQLYNPEYEGAQTFVSSPEFWDAIRDRAAYWGSTVGARYGEPLYSDAPIRMDGLPGLEKAR